MGTNVEPCEVDLDCRANEFCFVNTDWYKSLESWDNITYGQTPGCACNTWQLWKGENCDQYKVSGIVLIVWTLLLSFMCLYQLVISTMSIIRYYRKLRGCRLGPGMVTALLSFPAAIGNWFWTLSEFGSSLMVEGPFVGPPEYYETDPYKGRLDLLGFVGAGFGTSALAFEAVTISLVWLQLARGISSFTFIKESSVKRYKTVAYTFLAVSILANIVGASIERALIDINIQGFLLAIYLFVLLGVYAFSYKKFNEIMNHRALKRHDMSRSNSNSSDLDRYKDVIRIVRSTTVKMFFWCSVTFLASLTFTITDLYFTQNGGDGWRETATPDVEISFIKISYTVNLTGFVFLQGVITSYMYQTSIAPRKSSGATTAVVNVTGTRLSEEI